MNYIVGELWENKEKGTTSLMNEKFHATIDAALSDYTQRYRSTIQQPVICKILQVKTVLVDYDAAGPMEVPIGG